MTGAYLVTRGLWLPIGIHAAWNFTQGGIFGVTVSGHPAEGLIRGTLTGPEWLAGGEFGAEASVVATAFCLMAGLFFSPWPSESTVSCSRFGAGQWFDL